MGDYYESGEKYLEKPWSTDQRFMSGSLPIPETGSELYIYDYNRGKASEIKIDLLPDNVSENYSPRIVKQAPFGIAHPVNFYVGGSSKTIQFSFDVHEDFTENRTSSPKSSYLKKRELTIYDFVEKIRRMSDSSKGKTSDTGSNYIKPPEVYLQLGDQFAGRGHIQSNFSFKKPFAKGRYKMVSISITFTFHEIFESRNINILDDGLVSISTGYAEDSLVSKEDLQAAGLDIPIQSFYDEAFGDEYFVNSYNLVKRKLQDLFSVSFQPGMNFVTLYEGSDYPFMAGTEKLNPNVSPDRFYRSVVDWYLSPKIGSEEVEEYEDVLHAINYGTYFTGDRTIHPYIVRMMEILRSYYYIVGLADDLSYNDAVANLEVILADLRELISDYMDPDPRAGSSQDRGVWYREAAIHIMSSSELSVFDEIIGYRPGYTAYNASGSYKVPAKWTGNGIQDILENYIYTYNVVMGAGE